MKLARHIRWLLPLMLLTALGLGVVHWKHAHDPLAFVNHWGMLFRKYRTPETFPEIKTSDRADLIFVRTFDSTEWVAARTEYSCTDGAGFDATVFLDSHGAIKYQIGYHFCGYEGLCGELRKVEADNLPEFYAKLTNVVIRVWDGKAANQTMKRTTGAVVAYLGRSAYRVFDGILSSRLCSGRRRSRAGRPLRWL